MGNPLQRNRVSTSVRVSVQQIPEVTTRWLICLVVAFWKCWKVPEAPLWEQVVLQQCSEIQTACGFDIGSSKASYHMHTLICCQENQTTRTHIHILGHINKHQSKHYIFFWSAYRNEQCFCYVIVCNVMALGIIQMNISVQLNIVCHSLLIDKPHNPMVNAGAIVISSLIKVRKLLASHTTKYTENCINP